MANGLFGPSAQQIFREQRQRTSGLLTSQGFNPIAVQAGLAGDLLGRALGNMAGAEDPQLREARIASEVKNDVARAGLSPADPNYALEVAKLFAARGLNDRAMQAMQLFQSQQTQQLQQENLASQIQQRRQPRAPTTNELLIMAGQGDPAALAWLQQMEDLKAAGAARTQININPATARVIGSAENIERNLKGFADTWENELSSKEKFAAVIAMRGPREGFLGALSDIGRRAALGQEGFDKINRLRSQVDNAATDIVVAKLGTTATDAATNRILNLVYPRLFESEEITVGRLEEQIDQAIRQLGLVRGDGAAQTTPLPEISGPTSVPLGSPGNPITAGDL